MYTQQRTCSNCLHAGMCVFYVEKLRDYWNILWPQDILPVSDSLE